MGKRGRASRGGESGGEIQTGKLVGPSPAESGKDEGGNLHKGRYTVEGDNDSSQFDVSRNPPWKTLPKPTCSALNCVPLKKYAEVLTPGTSECDLIRKLDLVDEIS